MDTSIDLLRGTTLSSVIYHLSGRRYFRHAEEKDSPIIPTHFNHKASTDSTKLDDEKRNVNVVTFARDNDVEVKFNGHRIPNTVGLT